MLKHIAEQEGQGVVEYGPISFALTPAAVSTLTLLGTPIEQIYQNVAGLLPNQ